jgi:hypothetical protein
MPQTSSRLNRSIYARPEYGFLLELQQRHLPTPNINTDFAYHITLLDRYTDTVGTLRAAIDASFDRMPLAIFAGIKGHPSGALFYNRMSLPISRVISGLRSAVPRWTRDRRRDS